MEIAYKSECVLEITVFSDVMAKVWTGVVNHTSLDIITKIYATIVTGFNLCLITA